MNLSFLEFSSPVTATKASWLFTILIQELDIVEKILG